MRALFMLIFFGGSLATSLYSYQLGQAHKRCDCGCNSQAEAIPNYVTTYFDNAYLRLPDVRYEYCNVLGTNAPRVPLLIDLYGLAGILFLLGIFVATKERSSLL